MGEWRNWTMIIIFVYQKLSGPTDHGRWTGGDIYHTWMPAWFWVRQREVKRLRWDLKTCVSVS